MIGLDATYSVGRNLTGVGVYSRQILYGLATAHPADRYLFCYRPHRFLRSFRESLPKRASRALLWRGWPAGIDLFHGLNQRIDSARYRRTVSTFHDLFVISGDYSTAEFRARFTEQAKLAAERSDLIIAVSQFTAGQVEQYLGVERSRIRVIHHGVLPPPRMERKPEKLILFVGAIQKRKNVLRLVQAFERTQPGWKLVLVGSSGYGADEVFQAIAASPRRADVETPGYVNDEQLEALYSRASLFAFPSIDEGFGMPVLDAMARGIPVITSNRSALPEVAGDAAWLVDPYDVESIRSALETLQGDDRLRTKLAEQGLGRSAQFQWVTAVNRTQAVYRELLD